MDRITTNDFMTSLLKRLMDTRKDAEGKEKPGLTESSAVSYLKTLYNLNEKKPGAYGCSGFRQSEAF